MLVIKLKKHYGLLGDYIIDETTGTSYNLQSKGNMLAFRDMLNNQPDCKETVIEICDSLRASFERNFNEQISELELKGFDTTNMRQYRDGLLAGIDGVKSCLETQLD